MQQALVVSQCVESTTTLVESVVELVSEEPPQETRKEATTNIKRTFFIIFLFFDFLFFVYMENRIHCFRKNGFFMKKFKIGFRT
jgi:hypothetical protein